MTISCQELKAIIRGFSLIQQCDEIKNGMLRMSTPFQYPDGSFIDLFIGQTQELFPVLVLTDLGQTTSYLMDIHVKPWTTKKRKLIISDICEGLGVEQKGGEFQINIDLKDLNNLPEAMVRLGQACIRVADLALTQRLRTPSAFKDEVEEFIESTNLKYETPIILMGQYNKEVELDFRVFGMKITSLILTISTGNASASHGLSNEVFRRWYDLEPQRQGYQFLTVFDTSNDIFRDDDLARLGSISTVIGFPAQQDQLATSLAA